MIRVDSSIQAHTILSQGLGFISLYDNVSHLYTQKHQVNTTTANLNTTLDNVLLMDILHSNLK